MAGMHSVLQKQAKRSPVSSFALVRGIKNAMENKTKIDHIEFWVRNLQLSLRWYRHLFSIIGWRQIAKNAFSNGETTIYFVEQKVRAQKTIGCRHICFYASSHGMVDKVGAFLKKNKNIIIRGPVASKYKSFRSYTIDFKDLDGYIIEVTADAKPR